MVYLRREVTRQSLEYGAFRFGVVHLNEQDPYYGSVGIRWFVGASSRLRQWLRLVMTQPLLMQLS